MRNVLRVWGGTLVVGVLLLQGAVWAMLSPMQQVKETTDAVLQVVTDEGLDRDAKRARITDLLKDGFDFRTMSKLTLGLNWKKATPAEQERFVDLFTEVLKWTYITRIEDYSGETVEYGEERMTKKNRAEVETFIVTTNSTRIPISYKVHLSDDKWRAYDVVIEGVSLIRNYRGNYREIVKRDGFDGLFALMEEKIERLEQAKKGTDQA